jgi:hypothetical protein
MFIGDMELDDTFHPSVSSKNLPNDGTSARLRGLDAPSTPA